MTLCGKLAGATISSSTALIMLNSNRGFHPNVTKVIKVEVMVVFMGFCQVLFLYCFQLWLK